MMVNVINNRPQETFWNSQLGQSTAQWEQSVFNSFSTGAFGYYALNLGARNVGYDPLLYCAVQQCMQLGIDLIMDVEDWPFQNDSLDYITLPHVLENSSDPHAVLREAARCVRPGGHIVLTAFNPRSVLAIRSKAAGLSDAHQWIARNRLLDWLRLLDLHPDRGAFGQWRPPCKQVKQFQKLAWLDAAGERWWPHMANVYALRVVKKVMPDIRQMRTQSRLQFARSNGQLGVLQITPAHTSNSET